MASASRGQLLSQTMPARREFNAVSIGARATTSNAKSTRFWRKQRRWRMGSSFAILPRWGSQKCVARFPSISRIQICARGEGFAEILHELGVEAPACRIGTKYVQAFFMSVCGPVRAFAGQGIVNVGDRQNAH